MTFEFERNGSGFGDGIGELVIAVKLMAISDIASGVAKGELNEIAKLKLEAMLESAKEKGETQEIIHGFEQAIIRVAQVD